MIVRGAATFARDQRVSRLTAYTLSPFCLVMSTWYIRHLGLPCTAHLCHILFSHCGLHLTPCVCPFPLLSVSHIFRHGLHPTLVVCIAGLQRINTTSASLPPASQGLAHPHQHLQQQEAYPPEPPAAVAQQQQQVQVQPPALPPQLPNGKTALMPLVKCLASGRVKAA